MSLDIALLQIIKRKKDYDILRGNIPDKALDPKTAALVKDFGRYFKESGTAEIGPSFWTTFFPAYHSKLDDQQLAIYQALAGQIADDPDPTVAEGIRARLISADVADKLADLITKFAEGEEVDIYQDMRGLVEYFEKETNRRVKTPWVRPDIRAMFDDDKNDVGLHWRLACLNKSMRPLRSGDFIVVAARPDKGKSSFLTDEATFFAGQVEELYGTDRPIIWLNNEGPGDRIYKRLYNSALNKSNEELWPLADAGLLEAEFMKQVGGADIYDRIRIIDIHDFWHSDVEDIIRQMNPCMVIFDMIDNVRFGGDVLNGGTRTDQLLEAQYQWARCLGVKYDAVMLATSQISGDGDGLPYPSLSMLKDSKTGKQGAADAIITVGASNDPSLEAVRFIGTTKNKLARGSGPKNPKAQTILDGARGRYIESEGIE